MQQFINNGITWKYNKTSLGILTHKLAMSVMLQANIDGTNQVIGIGDSGIDMNSCYFTDPNVPFSIGNVNGRPVSAAFNRHVQYLHPHLYTVKDVKYHSE
jgi:hypothetical protein